MKRFTKIVERCNECPRVTTDDNIIMLKCMVDGSERFICWIGNGEDDEVEIPDWCPLEEVYTC